jgi:hypothetical protein
VPDNRNPVTQLTSRELERYGNQLARCLKALEVSAPIRARVQGELTLVRAEQQARASTASRVTDPQRRYDAAGLTTGELERTRRELAASLALIRPGSPARVPILAQLSAIDAELAGRASQQPHDRRPPLRP